MAYDFRHGERIRRNLTCASFSPNSRVQTSTSLPRRRSWDPWTLLSSMAERRPRRPPSVAKRDVPGAEAPGISQENNRFLARELADVRARLQLQTCQVRALRKQLVDLRTSPATADKSTQTSSNVRTAAPASAPSRAEHSEAPANPVARAFPPHAKAARSTPRISYAEPSLKTKMRRPRSP